MNVAHDVLWSHGRLLGMARQSQQGEARKLGDGDWLSQETLFPENIR